MSCYLTDAEAIGKIARWAADNCTSAFNPATKDFTKLGGQAPEIALVLGAQNVASCEARYPEHGPAGGFLDDGITPADYVAACCQRARYRGHSTSPAAVWRMVASLEYQSCETEDWFDSDAFWICRAIKEAAGRKMAEDLVSVEARQWT
jgi:hypothetical protein